WFSPMRSGFDSRRPNFYIWNHLLSAKQGLLFTAVPEWATGSEDWFSSPGLSERVENEPVPTLRGDWQGPWYQICHIQGTQAEQ
ncbi:hypothetical protein KIPB_014435, partial [Kipferlia bialata]